MILTLKRWKCKKCGIIQKLVVASGGLCRKCYASLVKEVKEK